MNLIKSKFYLLVVLLIWVKHINAQTGMHQNAENASIIPLLEGNDLIGHAYIYFLDKVSKDSNSYVLQVFDEYLHEVGEKKIMLSSSSYFNKAAFNGENIVVKFYDSKKNFFRYNVFNQKAELLLDTIINTNGRTSSGTEIHESVYTKIHSISKVGVLDYFVIQDKGKDYASVNFIGNDNKIWEYRHDEPKASLHFLSADKTMTVHTLYRTKANSLGNIVRTYIQCLSTQGGRQIFDADLNNEDDICIYPISASITKEGIDIISEFTKKNSRFGRIKYGVCTHQLDLNGKIRSSEFNEITQTMMEDSLVKKHKLFQYSYLYMHKGLRLKNGKWLIAAEQLKRTYGRREGFFKPHQCVYNKKTLCMLEVDPKTAKVLKMHIEPNKEDGVIIANQFERQPHRGGMYMQNFSATDIRYFIQDESSPDDKISFVFIDQDGKNNSASIGNLLYHNGDYKLDKIKVKSFGLTTSFTIVPARFGHVLLFKYDPSSGNIDFDNIKFNL